MKGIEYLNQIEGKIIEILKFYNQTSYCPYSNFRVSACLVIRNNKLNELNFVGGCNVENSSYGLSICAERNLIFKCISEGYFPDGKNLDWIFLCLYVPVKKFISPCGACRQVISEFVDDIPIVIYNQELQRKVLYLSEIFKERFSPTDLKNFQ
ncbi:MAG: cytidine deaminase [bacterium]